MGVLARELASYQSAVDQYLRNSTGFNNSLVQDANGNILVYMNGQYYSVPANGGNATPVSSFTTADGRQISRLGLNTFGQYGMTASSGDPNVYLVRQNPTGSTTNTVTGLRAMYDDSNNITGYYMTDASGNYVEAYAPAPGVQVQYEMVPQTDPNIAPTWKAIETQYQYIGEPQDFTRKPPDPTLAQVRKMNQIGSADAERLAGMDSGIIRSGGLKGGLRPPPAPVDGVNTGITNPPPAPEEPFYYEPTPVNYPVSQPGEYWNSTFIFDQPY